MLGTMNVKSLVSSLGIAKHIICFCCAIKTIFLVGGGGGVVSDEIWAKNVEFNIQQIGALDLWMITDT